MKHPTPQEMPLSFVPAAKETGRLARALDWGRHPLGPMESWPAGLKTAVGIILNSNFPMFLTWGEARNFLYNDAYIPVLGGKHPAAFGGAFQEVWQEIWPDLDPFVRAVDQGEAVYLDNLKLIMRRHGYDEETYFTFSYSPIHDESGAVRGLYCACIETTSERRLENSLRKSRESLQLALSSAQMGTWEIDIASGRTRFSEEAAAILSTGTDYRDVSESIESVIHPDDRARVQEKVRSAVAEGQTYLDEYRVVHPNGKLHWVQARGRLHFDIEGRPALLTGVVLDVTERRLAADTLAEAQDRLNLALVSSGSGFWDWNARTGFTYLSQTLMEDWGIDPGTYRNTLDEALLRIHPEDRERAWASIEQATFEGHPYDVEYRVVRPSGEVIWVNAKGKYYLNEKGEPERLSGTTVNITERKRNEEALVNAVKARDQFLSIASHELKTPLTSLRLQAQLHRRIIDKGDPSAYLPTRVNALVDQTEKQTSRLSRLVDDMLDVSRIRAGKLQIQREKVNVSQLADDVLTRLKNQFLSAGYPAPELIAPPEADAYLDRMRIEQVVINLLTNAIRYGRKNPVELRISAGGETIRIDVKDQGIGIAPEAREKIFDRFERAVDENEVSGLGLGLFITKQIILAHQGRIWVESTPGAGSVFSLELPKAAPAESALEVVHVL